MDKNKTKNVHLEMRNLKQSSASSLPITSNPEDGPSAPSATVTKNENLIKPSYYVC